MINRKINKAYYSLERAEQKYKESPNEAIDNLYFVIKYCKEVINCIEEEFNIK